MPDPTLRRAFRMPPPVRMLAARPRYLFATALAIALVVALGGVPPARRFLFAYDTGVLVWLVLVTEMVVRSDHEGIQRRADAEDAGAAVLLLLAALAAVASFVAIAADLPGLKEANGTDAALRLAFVIVTILASWLFVHVSFALHYAHDFYAGVQDRRGLDFPGEDKPDYWDFVYFAFNLGAAAQTSDVAVRSRRMRRLVLAHTVLSFLFNTTILALAINVGASLL